jgi:superoxide dismutase
MLDAANTEEAASASSAYRSIKIDEQFNLNAVKLHDLYFANISDLTSQVAADSIPYMRFAREFGSFDRWQFDFRACAMSAREGWAVTYYEPFKNVYMNCIVDGHSTGIPLGGIPVLVIDMWSHAYYRDWLDDKKGYINAMMREINWNVVEARMIVAERANLDSIFKIMPIMNTAPERILQNLSINSPPIERDQINSSEITGTNPAPQVGSQANPQKPVLPIS